MLEVALPVRPNGSTGFVRSSDVSLSTHRARIVVDLGAHRVTAWEEVAEGAVALGANATPTPPGEFYMNEVQEQDDADTLFGSWIIGLSGFSETLPLTDGMDPAIVLHGTNDPSLRSGPTSPRVTSECTTMSSHALPSFPRAPRRDQVLRAGVPAQLSEGSSG